MLKKEERVMRRTRAAILTLALLLSACGMASAPAGSAAPSISPTVGSAASNVAAPAPTALLQPAQQRPQQATAHPTLAAVPVALGQPADLSLPPGERTPPAPAPLAATPAIPADDPRAQGSSTAPVTIIVYSDFECPFCARFQRDTTPLIIQRYVQQGLVRLVYRDFPIPSLHRSAVVAAIAGRCAAAQNQFWPMHDLLFASHLDQWGGVPKRDRLAMVDLAGQINLDTETFTRCMDDPQIEQAVQQDIEQGRQLGIVGTPTFLINDRLVVGALPIDTFDRLITLNLPQTHK